MRDAAAQALSFVEARDRADLDGDVQLQLALVRALEIIGEAAARVTPETRSRHDHIPWQQAIRMRNRLIHAYFAIDLEIVWSTVTQALPELVAQIDDVIESNP